MQRVARAAVVTVALQLGLHIELPVVHSVAAPEGRGVASRQPAAHEFSFHHLHLNDSRPPFLLEFYERLFDPATTKRMTLAAVDGLRSGPMLLLISRGPDARPHQTALWHFGWGAVSLGESYLAHAAREVAWEPPLPAARLHMHVLSVTPSAAARWYGDILGARVEMATVRRPNNELPPEHWMPEALIWIGETALLIYRIDPPLFSTRGQQADHIAVSCRDLDAALGVLRVRGVTVLTEPAVVDNTRTAMIEGPDHLAIELVEDKGNGEKSR